MKCPKCKRGSLRQQVSVIVECDFENHNLCKKGIRNRDVKILGANWQHLYVYCPECGFFPFAKRRKK